MVKTFTIQFILFVCWLVLTFSQSYAQTEKDSINQLDEVVITAQYSRQSVKKSVYEVVIINRKMIEQNAANNLADLLNQTLNVSINPNTSTGKSEVSIMGLDGQYAKVLIDNIPVINEEGVGNNIDLTLINLDDVEQIEIVEGAMGVQYGSNAVSGIINIITKKKAKQKFKLTASIQEETVGTEYEWFAKGKHIQSAKLEYNFTENLFGRISYLRNDFGGFWDTRKGRVHDQNDELRGHAWLPKEQHNPKLLLNYKKGDFNLFYKFGYFREKLQKYNQTVDLNENTATATFSPSALDRIYTNYRYINNLNATGILGKAVNFDFSLSYQKQSKDIKTFTYRIQKDKRENLQEKEYQSRAVFITRGSLGNLINTGFTKLQLGYDISLEKGRGSDLSLNLDPDVELVGQELNTYDLFSSAEFILSKRFSLRPGGRVSFSNLFDNQYIYSLSSKYLFDKEVELRTVLGSANRTPNYTELFELFVHPAHDIFGNKDLKPESGYSVFSHLKKTSWLNDNTRITNKFSFGYINLKDKIELLLDESYVKTTFQYINVNKHETLNFSTTNSLQYNDFKVSLGLTYMGISQSLGQTNQDLDKYLFSPKINLGLFYNLRKANTSFSIAYKYNGKRNRYVIKEEEYVQGTTEDYSWFDATIKKSFFDKRIKTTLGVRNIFDVTQVETTAIYGGGHDGATSAIELAYGRSYFIKLAYTIHQ